jgi:hypothetical protein
MPCSTTCLQVSIALLLALTPVLGGVAYAQEPRVPPTIEPRVGGLSEKLAVEVRRVQDAGQSQSAVARFANQLPYSSRTRALQAQAERLQGELAQAKTRSAAERISAQLRALSDRMLEDPSYREIMQALDTVLPPDTVRTRRIQRPSSNTTATGAMQATASVAWGLWPGVVMLLHSSSSSKPDFLYTRWYSHAGTYAGSGAVYEANPDGVRLKPLANWQQPGQYVALGYNRSADAAGVQRVADALVASEARYGTDGRTPYNYSFPDKWTDSGLYCSQLIWKIQQGAGADVDSNDVGYQMWIAARWGGWAASTIAIPAVAPDEIAADDDIYYFWADWTG